MLKGLFNVYKRLNVVDKIFNFVYISCLDLLQYTLEVIFVLTLFVKEGSNIDWKNNTILRIESEFDKTNLSLN